MIEITPDNALDYLRRTGRIGKDAATVAALGWGVSNVVLRVESEQGLFILKQSRPQLRTRDLWISDIARVWREQEVMEALGPLLPVGVVPRVLFTESLEPGTYYLVLYNVPRDPLTGTGSDNTESVALQLGLTVYPFTSQAAPGAVSIGRTQVIQPTH